MLLLIGAAAALFLIKTPSGATLAESLGAQVSGAFGGSTSPQGGAPAVNPSAPLSAPKPTAGGTVQEITSRQGHKSAALSTEEATALNEMAVKLYNAAAGNKNFAEMDRAYGMQQLARGTPVGVSPTAAKFLSSTGSGSQTSNPNNYISQGNGGVYRYVGPSTYGTTVI